MYRYANIKKLWWDTMSHTRTVQSLAKLICQVWVGAHLVFLSMIFQVLRAWVNNLRGGHKSSKSPIAILDKQEFLL